MPPERRPDDNSDHDDMRVRMIHNRSHGPHRPWARDAYPPPPEDPSTALTPTRRAKVAKALRAAGRPSKGRST